MRILMLNNEFPPLGGGTGVINYQLLKELQAYPNIWVDLITSSRSRKTYETEALSERITVYKVPVDNHNIHHSSNQELLRYAWLALGMGKKLIKRYTYDVSFAFAGVPAGAISCALKFTCGLPYLLSLQGPDVPGFEARYSYLYPFLKPILRIIWQQAGVVTACSEKHQQLAHRTLNDISIPIVHNGVEVDTFFPGKSTPMDSLNLLCVGRLIERKGQHYLLRAFAQLRALFPQQALRLTLVGTGDAEASLKQLANELNIGESVHFAGFVSRQEMPPIYQRADIFVLPSQEEGMSVALLEALAAGLPVVVTEAGGTDELVTPGENGFVVHWADVVGLVSALKHLIENGDLRNQMGSSSRNIALAHSSANMTEHFVQMLNTLVMKSAICGVGGIP